MIVTDKFIMINGNTTASPTPSSMLKGLQAVGFPAVRVVKVQPLLDSTIPTRLLVEIKGIQPAILGGDIVAKRHDCGYWEVLIGSVGVAVPRGRYLPQYKELGKRMRIWQQQHKALTFAQPYKALPPLPRKWAVELMDQPIEDGWLPHPFALIQPPSSTMTAAYRLWALTSLPKNGRVKQPLVLSLNDYHTRIGLGSIGEVEV